METIKEISNSIKENSRLLNEYRKIEKKCYFFQIIALISILNFSAPLLASGFTSCNTMVLNFYKLIDTNLLIDFSNGSPLSPENFATNDM